MAIAKNESFQMNLFSFCDRFQSFVQHCYSLLLHQELMCCNGECAY